MMHISAHAVKTASMPLGMILGVLFCRQVDAVDKWSGETITPILISLMLFCTFCRVDVRRMRPNRMHLWLLAVQMIGCLAVYDALLEQQKRSERT